MLKSKYIMRILNEVIGLLVKGKGSIDKMISVLVHCNAPDAPHMDIGIRWLIRKTPCWQEYATLDYEVRHFISSVVLSFESKLR